MTKKASYRIIPEFKLILETFSGDIKINDVLELKRRELEDENYNPNYNFIISSTGIIMKAFSTSDIKIIANSIKKDLKLIGARRTAILTATPRQVAASTLYKKETKGLSMNFKIVSTLQAALNWIALPVEYESYIDEHIMSLENHTITK